MIVYFDPPASVPPLVTEPGTPVARELWEAADDVATTRRPYVGGRRGPGASRHRRLSGDAVSGAGWPCG